MKKILFATTALVASAGIASAQDLGVSLSGMAEMGIFDDGSEDAQFFTDIDVTFRMSGEADNGLTFGANIDIDEAGNGEPFENPRTQGGEAIFVSFAGATLTMGDTDGAYDARLAEMALAGGSLADDETGHIGFDDQDGFFDSGQGFDGNSDGQIARFDYTYNSFTGSFSVEQGDVFGRTGNAFPDNIYGIGFSYDTAMAGIDIGIGLAYQTQEDFGDAVGLTVTGGFSNGLSAGLSLAQADYDFAPETESHVGVGVGYTMNAIAVGLNYGKYTNFGGLKGDDYSGVGLAASYDLGGGLSARLGYSNSDFDGDADDVNTYSLGLRMNF